ncbi:MAG: MogA/MoaB family molybdenum cofactor biosynthesis protein [Deltaproteobacteria bacterium]|nr:MogA/MoaB family molybdenum cofactor biosynthesis protein [Deltaproteobacteria bacterium]
MIRAAVVTLSDRSFREERPGASGPAVAEMLRSLPAKIAQQVVIPDEIPFIRRALLHFCDAPALDLVVTTGGTGVDPRDVTPDATREILDRFVREWGAPRSSCGGGTRGSVFRTGVGCPPFFLRWGYPRKRISYGSGAPPTSEATPPEPAGRRVALRRVLEWLPAAPRPSTRSGSRGHG